MALRQFNMDEHFHVCTCQQRGATQVGLVVFVVESLRDDVQLKGSAYGMPFSSFRLDMTYNNVKRCLWISQAGSTNGFAALFGGTSESAK